MHVCVIQEDNFDLDLTYITKNIIAMGFPSHGTEAAYRNPMTEVCFVIHAFNRVVLVTRQRIIERLALIKARVFSCTPCMPPFRQVQRFFNEKHFSKYRIYNICSERHYPSDKFQPSGASSHRFRFDDHNPCRLELMEPMCKDMHDWLTQDEENVAAIHCKAGKVGEGTCGMTWWDHL